MIKKVIYLSALMNAAKDRTLMMIPDGYSVKEALKAEGFRFDGQYQIWYKVIEESPAKALEDLSAKINDDKTVIQTLPVKKSGYETSMRSLQAEVFGGKE